MEPYYIQNLFHFLKDDQDPDQVSDPTKLGQAFGSGSDSAGEIPLQPFFYYQIFWQGLLLSQEGNGSTCDLIRQVNSWYGTTTSFVLLD